MSAPPKPYTTRKVPESLGKGEVRLYDAHKTGLPDLPTTPPEKKLAQYQWWLVHFPARRAVPVEGDRVEGLRILKKLEKGTDELGLLPKPKVKTPKKAKCASTRTAAPARARGDEGKKDGGKDDPAPPAFTAVPEDMNFDAAMKHVFPNQRITAKLEALMEAQKPIYDRDGNLVAHAPDYITQIAALKMGIEHAQGRAGEKPPPPPDKKKVSYEELEEMLRTNKAARMVFTNLLKQISAESDSPVEPSPSVLPVEEKPGT